VDLDIIYVETTHCEEGATGKAKTTKQQQKKQNKKTNKQTNKQANKQT